MDTLSTIIVNTWYAFTLLVKSPFEHGFVSFAYKFIPFVIFIELPIYLFIWLGILRYSLRERGGREPTTLFSPMVSCVVLCYAEGKAIQNTVISLAEQAYPGWIEILAIIDGASRNKETYEAAMALRSIVAERPNRILRVIPKWQRGGRVSSLNAGLSMARGSIVMALDGDTSFDNTMVQNAIPHFNDPHVMAVAGNLRVRNFRKSLTARLQSIEYMISIHAAKIGLSEFNVVNNVSGAFGIFRKSILHKVGGWDSGTAEDLDMTMKIKSYFGMHPELKIVFEPYATGHTDAPETLASLFDQRLRWDGDLFYLYVRKRRLNFNRKIIGVRNLIMSMWTGLFFQLVMPMVIILYTILVFTMYPVHFVLAIWLLVYMVYFLITLVLFITYIALVSDRKGSDLKLGVYLPLFPGFMFILRLWSGLAVLKEIFLKSHLDSSMAPWWVLKRTKF
ncbi:MAG: N-acetylglucosaminyltransferase [Desulfobacterales bacterium]|nr:MAG: N-acetylglucosaminyltransferase [Desulfobacterales bacterium]